MNWMRTSKSWILRLKIAIEDYRANRDLSWARTDSYGCTRWWAARAAYENYKDLSWARKDSDQHVRLYAAHADYSNNKDFNFYVYKGVFARMSNMGYKEFVKIAKEDLK